MTIEKRKNTRRAMRYGAWIGIGAESPLSGCMVSDISETGARLVLENPKELPEMFNLLLSGRGGIYRRCRVVWRRDNQVGVHFQKAGASAQKEPVKAAEPADA